MFVLVIAINVLFMVAAAILAWRKGYNALLWFLAGSPLAILVLLFQPNTKSGPFALEDEVRQRGRVNRIALALILLSVVAGIWFAVATPREGTSSQVRPVDSSITLQAATEQASRDQAALAAAESARVPSTTAG